MQLSGSATGRLLSKSLVRDPQMNFKVKYYLSYRQIGYFFLRIVRIPPMFPNPFPYCFWATFQEQKGCFPLPAAGNSVYREQNGRFSLPVNAISYRREREIAFLLPGSCQKAMGIGTGKQRDGIGASQKRQGVPQLPILVGWETAG